MLNATPHHKEIGVDRKFTLYINDKDREEIERLREALSPVIDALPNKKDYVDPRGNLSVAGMFRYLRHEEMDRLGMPR